MRIPRCYIDQALAIDTTVHFPVETAHYLRAVLRLGAGDAVVLFDGRGGEYQAELTNERHLLGAQVLTHIAREVESPVKVHLAQTLTKGEKLDWVMQKATELGVAMITPITTTRCEVRLASDRLERKRDHWRQIMINACAQSGRNRIPNLHDPVSLEHWLELHAGIDATRIALTPSREACTLATLAPPKPWILLVVGPEGGLTDTEVDALEVANFTAVALGPRVLRTETAACAALATIQALWGDFT